MEQYITLLHQETVLVETYKSYHGSNIDELKSSEENRLNLLTEDSNGHWTSKFKIRNRQADSGTELISLPDSLKKLLYLKCFKEKSKPTKT